MAAAQGAQPHVTRPLPVPRRRGPGDAVRARTRGIAARVEPFEVRFATRPPVPRAWSGSSPEPAEPFIALTEAIAARWPDYPPYDGAFDEVIPHLTIVESRGPRRSTGSPPRHAGLPFIGRGRERLELWCQDDGAGPGGGSRSVPFPLGRTVRP